MKTYIVVITSKYLYPFVQKTVADSNLDCSIQIIEYHNFYHLTEIYKEYEAKADGFMISGKTALAAVEKALPAHKRPIIAFEASIISLYRLLLDIFLENRQLEPGRVLFDFLLPLYKNAEQATAEHLLYHKTIRQIRTDTENWLNNITLQEISLVEQQITEGIIRLWDNHKTDLVICHYGSIIPLLEEHEIPYRFSPPTKEDFIFLANSLLSQIELNRLRDNLPGVIAVTLLGKDKRTIPKTSLKKALSNITNELALNVILQEEEEDKCYIFTTLRAIECITDKLRKCNIRPALKKKYGIDAYVGYGIGNDITAAKSNAQDALKEGLFSKGCFVFDEKHNLLGPLNAKKYFEVRGDISKEIYTTAERCKLSTLTIQKLLSIIEMTGSNKMTQQSLAEHLGVTTRNASRILGNLEKGGAASIAYTQSITSKGRPIKVYELNIKA